MKKKSLVAMLALVVVILASATSAFAQELGPRETPVINEDVAIDIKITWQFLRITGALIVGFLVGLIARGMRREHVVTTGRTAIMLAVLLLGANSAFAQEAPSPFDGPPAATQPATPAPPVMTTPVAPIPAPSAPAVETVTKAQHEAALRELNAEWKRASDAKDTELAKFAATENWGVWT